jgi:RNA polymerase sigma-70 factor (sigma-E family)
MGVGGEPVNTVVDSIDSQSSDTISDDPTTVDDHESLGGLLGRNEAATDPVLKSAKVDAIGAPSANPAGDAVDDGAAVGAPAPDTPSDEAEAAEASADGLQLADDNDSDNGTDDGDDNEVRNLGVDCEPPDPAARPTDVTETLEASVLLPDVAFATEAIAPAALAGEAFSAPTRRATAVWDAADAVTEIYHVHYNQFVRLAVLLLHDVQTAEEVVQESFEAMHVAWRRLNDKDKALQYLRQTVVNKSRSVLRHRKVVDMHAPKPAPDEPSAEQAALVLLERTAVAAALRSLPERQREAIALRYYADFSEADIAKAMGISKGAVKSHTARAMATLKTVLTQAEAS